MFPKDEAKLDALMTKHKIDPVVAGAIRSALQSLTSGNRHFAHELRFPSVIRRPFAEGNMTWIRFAATFTVVRPDSDQTFTSRAVVNISAQGKVRGRWAKSNSAVRQQARAS